MREPHDDRAEAQPALTMPEGLWAPRRRLTAISLLLSIGIVAFDELGVTTALPRIAGELGGFATYGWAVSTVVLATMVGGAVAGQVADRHGPDHTSAAGFAVFAVGLIVSGAASDWSVFLLGRLVQGLGAGAIVATVYVVVALRLPLEMRSRGFALVSSAWMIPALVGPALSGLVTDALGWRAVFGLLLVSSVLAGGTSIAVNRRDRPAVTAPRGPEQPRMAGSVAATTAWSCVLAVSVGALLVGLERDTGLLGAALMLLGTAGAAVALLRVTPPGTLRARRGLPAGVATRALLTAGFFGASTFLTLLLTEIRGSSATAAGFVVASGSLAWSLGAALQARTDRSRRDRQILVGYATLIVGLGSVAVVLLATVWPTTVAALGWSLAGFGMGMAYNVTTTAALDRTSATNHGRASSALQIAQTLGIALTAGAGTAVLAQTSQNLTLGFGVLFAATALCALAGLPLARRIAA